MGASDNPLKSLKKVHIVGVGGTLMGAFAVLLKRLGVDVTGTDQNLYPPMSDVLANAGVQVFQGYNAENLKNLSPKPDLVVIGNVIRRDNPEARAAIDGGYPYDSLPGFMERFLLKETRNIVAAGTHGKTTTASLMTHVLRHAGGDPSYFIGGVSLDLPHSFHVSELSKNAPFVLEGDEYDTAFWDKVPKFTHYRPVDTILTSVEFDHVDIYPNIEAVQRVFENLVEMTSKEGRLIACFDYLKIKEMVSRSNANLISYGSSKETGAQFYFENLEQDGEISRFDIFEGGKKVANFKFPLSGRHNALNVLAVWIEARALELSDEKIQEALMAFRGVKRRQEVRAEIGGITVIDDFAHHPTAVRETLAALKKRFGKRRLISVFEPRSATSRRNIFQDEYSKAFQNADVVFMARPFNLEAIPVDERLSSEKIVEEVSAHGTQVYLMEGVDKGVQQLVEMARPGDVIAVLSNGGFEGFIPKTIEGLKKR